MQIGTGTKSYYGGGYPYSIPKRRLTSGSSFIPKPSISKSYAPPKKYTPVGGGAVGTSNLSSFGSTATPKTNPVVTQRSVTGTSETGGTGGYSSGGYAYPDFNVDLAGIWESAGAMADSEINPQLEEIARLLTEAGYSAQESQNAIAEAYPLARRSLQKQIFESFQAGEQSLAGMGTGRGGGRQEILARGAERESLGLEGIETAKTREVGAINRALENYRGQMGNQKVALEGQRGNLRAGYAEQLRGNRFNEAAARYGFDMQRAQLDEQTRQFNTSLAARSSGSGTTIDPNTGKYNIPDTNMWLTPGQAIDAGYVNTGQYYPGGSTDTPKSYVEILEEAAAKAAYRNLLGYKGNQIWNM